MPVKVIHPSFWVAAGGALGAVMRYWLVLAIGRLMPTRFPWGTFCVNMLGCWLIGLVAAVLLQHTDQSGIWKSFLIVGCLGGFTTFSAFSYEWLQLMQDSMSVEALFYLIATVVVTLLATWLGFRLGSRF